ncbi:hypothetical protein [Amycolatopsis sp.]|jgi:hypothetical protein|uniref:hypothetical protein n=1 Tax=Amycolatopsis sp. TaxID=37632 RepID=UPI002DF97C74|nr:hypothetical protein [Amycolatopsis sp.]
MTAARSEQPLDPLTSMLSAVARRAENQFRGRNLTIRRSTVVHAVAPSRWMAGVDLPAPACHVGVSGWAVEDLHPTSQPVTCRRCLRSPGARSVEAHNSGHQLELALEVA